MCEMDTWATLHFLCFPIRMQDLLRKKKKSSHLSFRPPPRSLPPLLSVTDFAGHRTKCLSLLGRSVKTGRQLHPKLYFDRVNRLHSYSEPNGVERGHLLAVNSTVDSATGRKSIWQEGSAPDLPSLAGEAPQYGTVLLIHLLYTAGETHFFKTEGQQVEINELYYKCKTCLFYVHTIIQKFLNSQSHFHVFTVMARI